jgi:hypothetical protein
VQRKFLFTPTIAALILFACAGEVSAQEETPRFEIGAQFTTLRLGELDTTEPGFGGRFTYNINDNFAVEAEGNFFPRDRNPEETQTSAEYLETLAGGRKAQALFGVKAGVRGKRVGVFGKVRPGFVRFSRFTRNGRVPIFDPSAPPPPPPPPFFSETNVALDLGGVFEVYPSRRVVIRIDVGDTIIRSDSGEEILVPDEADIGGQKPLVRSTTNNLQVSVGLSFRF